MENQQLTHQEFKAQEKKFPLRILAHDLQLGANVGSLFRLADALGVERLYLTGITPTPPQQRLRKAARATEQAVAYTIANTAEEVIAQCRQEGYTIASLEMTAASVALHEFSPPKNIVGLCLILGAENAGVAASLLALSDHTLHIPMAGRNSSMNVAMACAIAVYDITGKMSKNFLAEYRNNHA
jgi:tRNA G18 (ribose-2'-O)-methylase SpoU